MTLTYVPPPTAAADERATDRTVLQGADPGTVREALDRGDPLPGGTGFAGLDEGTVVRDVLGRRPLFLDPHDGEWSFAPIPLSDPVEFPAGHALEVGDRTGPVDPDRARRVWSIPDPEPIQDRDEAVASVSSALAAVSLPDVPVAFSGGVDSGLLAARSAGPLYVAGFPESHDVEWARRAAADLGRTVRVVEVTHDLLRETVPEVVRATGRSNAMDVGIAVPLYLVARQAAADGHDRLLVGQGADELFGGYAKVAKAPDDPRVDADTVRGATREVIASLPGQLARDVPNVRSAGVEPVTPFLDDRVIAAALELPGHHLVDGDTRKVALREAAREWVPESIATRDKKAVQYGSLVARELDRLARQNGFKRRMDDHVDRYVASLLKDG